MKKLFDFMYCDGALTPSTIWYTVTVGISATDKKAKGFIEAKAKCSTNFLFLQHDNQMAEFKEKVAISLFGDTIDQGMSPVAYLRQKFVTVTQLASFLRSNPATLLNSEAIPMPKGSLSLLARSARVQSQSVSR